MALSESSRGLAALALAADITSCRALIAGLPVHRSRLVPDVLRRIDKHPEGPPLVLTDELVLLVEATREIDPKYAEYARQLQNAKRRTHDAR